MLTYQQAHFQLAKQLEYIYDVGEASAIAHELMLHLTGLDKMQRIIHRERTFTIVQEHEYNNATQLLSEGMPLQYVTGIAWFLGKPYKVNSNVLIPRPETEELAKWISDEWKRKDIQVLDIGTGSGCIPVSLKLLLPQATVTTCDISSDAIRVAQENATNLNADITTMALDFLNEHSWEQLDKYDIIVSNPPYIPVSELPNIHSNVKDYEPHLALFVPNDDPFVFYRAIAHFGKTHLNTGGAIYCELHLDHALETGRLFESMDYKHVEVKKDIHGNYRMLKAF